MSELIWLQLIFPDLVEGLVLLNIDPNGKGWIDWAATKVADCSFDSLLASSAHFWFSNLLTISASDWQLSGLTSALPDTVLPHLFSQVSLQWPSFTAFLFLSNRNKKRNKNKPKSDLGSHKVTLSVWKALCMFLLVWFCVGGADEQHRAGAELQATNQQHPQPVQPAAFLEHVQQVWKYIQAHTPTHTYWFETHSWRYGPFQSTGPGDEPQRNGAQRQDSEVSPHTQLKP